MQVSGILKLSSRVKYGKNKRGIPYYRFKSSNKELPYLFVCSKSRLNKDVFAIVIVPTDSLKLKKPIGYLDFIIGEVGDIINEYKYILYQHNLVYKSWNNIIKKNNINTKIENDKILDINLQKLKPDYYVISIDPLGCTDIDDALHINITDTYTEIGVHITNVNYYLNSGLEDLIKDRLFSVYSPFNQQNMIPDIYANNLCSLLQGKNRKVISVIFKYNNKDSSFNYILLKKVLFII